MCVRLPEAQGDHQSHFCGIFARPNLTDVPYKDFGSVSPDSEDFVAEEGQSPANQPSADNRLLPTPINCLFIKNVIDLKDEVSRSRESLASGGGDFPSILGVQVDPSETVQSE